MPPKKPTPLERTVFLRRFRTTHINFWRKERPKYPEQPVTGVPKVIEHPEKQPDEPRTFTEEEVAKMNKQTDMGIDAHSAEDFWLKYGHDDLLPREDLFRFFFFLKHTPPQRCAHLLSGATWCSEEAWWASVHRVRSYLNGVVAEIRWTERLSEWNHVPHFPYFVTHYVDSMPIASIGGILCDVLFNPKYAGCVYKVTVAIDSLGGGGGIVWC